MSLNSLPSSITTRELWTALEVFLLIETSHIVNAPRDKVWEEFGTKFGDIADWAGMILESSLDGPVELGCTRTCTLAEGPLTEKLTRFEASTGELTYVVTSGLPGIVKTVENAWTLEDLGDGTTKVTSRVTLHLAWWAILLGPVVKSQFGKAIRPFLKQLAAHVESQKAA